MFPVIVWRFHMCDATWNEECTS